MRNESLCTKTMLVKLLLLTLLGTVRAQEEADVLILGAGAAGLAAAESLAAKNVSFLIIEGDSRIGGRVKSATFNGVPVEEGCPLLIGLNATVTEFVEMYNLTGKILDYESVVVRSPEGQRLDNMADAIWSRLESSQETVKELYMDIKAGRIPDMSIRVALENGNWFPQTSLEDVLEIYDYDFEFAQVPELMSTLGFEYVNEAQTFPFMSTNEGGLEKIITAKASMFLEADDPRLKLNEVVDKITYSGSLVNVTTASGMYYTGKYAIVTFSMGVLKRRSVVFEPSLPDWKLNTIFRTSMDVYSMVYVKYSSQIWENDEFILHANPRRGYYPIIQTFGTGTNVVAFHVFGEEARRIERADDEAIKSEVTDVLRGMYGLQSVSATDVMVTRWLQNPLTRGSFTSRAVGDNNPKFQEALKANVGRLYFAGEAYDDAFDGFLVGAIASGRSVAMKVYDCMKNGKCEMYDPNPQQPTVNPPACGSTTNHLSISLVAMIVLLRTLF